MYILKETSQSDKPKKALIKYGSKSERKKQDSLAVKQPWTSGAETQNQTRIGWGVDGFGTRHYCCHKCNSYFGLKCRWVNHKCR